MLSMHSSRLRCTDPSKGSDSATHNGGARLRTSLTTRLAALALMATAATVLPACSSGGGGDNGSSNPRDEVTAGGLNFTYPFDGQLDVLLDTQMIVNFPGDLGDVDTNALTLQDTNGNDIDPKITIDQDDTQGNILRLDRDGKSLQPNTDYQVVANADIGAGNTQFSKGDVLFTFRTRPLEGRPADGDFAVTSLSPGEENDLKPESSSKFTEFNAIRVVLNEPVDASTVNDDSFKVMDAEGNQITTGTNGSSADARLTALGRYIVFDPVEGNDFEPGEYTIEYTDAIKSVFGNTLTEGSKSRTVLDVGTPIDQTLVIEDDASSDNLDDLGDDLLSGKKVNNVNILSQLIGSNDQPVIGPGDVTANPPIRNRVATTLAESDNPAFDGQIPAVIRAGQKFQLKKLTLALGGEVPTPVISGPIDVNFINDVSVYLMANDYRNIEGPTAVRLRLDLGIGTLITAALNSDSEKFIIQQLANGVFNQSSLNIQAAGLAIPRDNGDLEISTLGSFPIKVNRTDDATVNFGLTLVLPSEPGNIDEGSGTEDNVAPFITAQSPSACLYAFGSQGYDSISQALGTAATALPEPFCTAPLTGNAPPNGGLGLTVNNFPIESSPAVTFSAPIDPATVNAESIQLTGNGTTVPATYRVEGFSVVIDPDELLEQDTDYQIRLGSQLADLSGTPLSGANAGGPGLTIDFTTEPLIDAAPAPALLGTLTPGIPCALKDDAENSFLGGGDNAGNCIGDAGNDTAPDYPVFKSPVNVPVTGVFSKFVMTDSVKLADGCLTSGSGETNTVDGASVALQEMDNAGQCVGTPPADLTFGNIGDDRTRSFSIRPVEALKDDTRYWVVVCGADGSQCNSTGTITDVDGFALNTTPLVGTGSQGEENIEAAEGGPDILMPFDTDEATQDYYALQFTLPETDTNGNARYDEGEQPQAGNRSLVTLDTQITPPIENPDRDDGKFVNYLSLTRPIAIREITDQCERVAEVMDDDGESAVGEIPDSCIPVSLLPGGFNSLTAINATALGLVTIDTGRIILRFPNDKKENPTGTPAQTGYIVDKCEGTFPAPTDYEGNAIGDPIPYDFEPCFTASLNLVANAPEGDGVELEQQAFTANVVGPVTFEQNGRLVISLRSANSIELKASVSGLNSSATIGAGDLNFQLVGNATHGGRALPSR